jgi:Yip1 domain
MAEYSSLAIAANVFTSPNEAFAAIKERPKFLLPLVLLLAMQAITSLAYINSVDLGWFMDTQLQASSAELTEAQREQAAAAAARVSPMVYGAIGAVSSAVVLVVVLLLTASYYTGVSFATNDGIKFKQWFSFACWCTLPAVLGVLASLINVLAADARFMPQTELNPLSFGNLLSIDVTGKSAAERILLSLDPTTVWALTIAVLGYHAWTNRSIVKAAAIVLGPLAVILAGAAALS